MAAAFEWEDSAEDRISFDSDPFEEDSMSLCSWVSENEADRGLTWRGWKKTASSGHERSLVQEPETDCGDVSSLTELSAQIVAKHYPFEVVEAHKPPVPEEIQLRIAFWSFPQSEDDIRLYSCLAHGSVDEFQRGEQHVKHKNVKNVLQIGFHLSGIIYHPQSLQGRTLNVAVTFDRGQINSCYCTCGPSATWCQHVIALCLFRVHHPEQVCLRAPVSESLSRLHRDQLQKFAQYLISELPQQILPTAQRLLDELLLSQESAINTLAGAPDPTAGASVHDQTRWCMDETALHENIKKILSRFCGPSPVAFVDLNSMFFTSSAPPAALEWSNLLRPLRAKDPESIWNLLDIVRNLFQVEDPNATKVLQILTEECLNFHQLALWWFTSETQNDEDPYSRSRDNNRSSTNLPATEVAKHTGAKLLEEHVSLWKVVVMNPKINDREKAEWKFKLEGWQKAVVEKARKGYSGNAASFNRAVEQFVGFKTAIEACNKDWKLTYMALGVRPEELTKSCCQVDCTALTRTSGRSDKSRTALLPIFQLGISNEGSISSEELIDIESIYCCLDALCTLGFNEVTNRLSIPFGERLLELLISCQTTKRALDYKLCWVIWRSLKTIFLGQGYSGHSKEHVHLAFRLALFGLGVPRCPATTKSMEVKLTHYEIHLHDSLKIMRIGTEELALVRHQAFMLCSGVLNRGEEILPLILAIFLFEVLAGINVESLYLISNEVTYVGCKTNEEDARLGYTTGIHALGMRSNASEKKHPMLCESIRRQRYDLALTLLWYCRNDSSKLKQVLSVLLDRSRYEGYHEGCYTQWPQAENWKDKRTTGTSAPANSQDGARPKNGFGRPGGPRDAGLKPKPAVRQISGDSSDDTKPVNIKARSANFRAPASGFGKRSFISSRPGFDNSNKNRRPRSNRGGRPKQNRRKPSSREHTESDSETQQKQGNKEMKDGGMQAGLTVSEDWEAEMSANDNPKEDEVITGLVTGIVQVQLSLVEDEKCPEVENEIDNGDDWRDIFEESDESDAVDSQNEVDILAIKLDNSCRETAEVSARNQSKFAKSDSQDFSSGNSSLSDEKFNEYNSATDDSPLLKVRSQSIKVSNNDSSNKRTYIEVHKTDVTFGTSGRNETPGNNVCHGKGAISKTMPVTLWNPESRKQRDRRGIFDDSDKGVELDQDLEIDEEAKEDTFGDEGFGSIKSISEFSKSLPENINENTGSFGAYEAHRRDTRTTNKLNNCPSNTRRMNSSVMCYNGGARCSWEPNRNGSKRCDTGESLAFPVCTFDDDSSECVGSNDSSEQGGPNLGVDNKSAAKPASRKKELRSVSSDRRHIEAEAYTLFELAKAVSQKATGKDDGSSLLHSAVEDDYQIRPNRPLQLAAFEIALFALRLHNRISPKWLSRTYSTHVSWIASQAAEIGATALQALNEHWEGVLTPAEIVDISSRASRSGDPRTKRSAAELALSCLPQAHTLNPGEIHNALTLCREQDTEMLERACSSIETAARYGGIHPELLFQLARQWHYLHDRLKDENEARPDERSDARNEQKRPKGPVVVTSSGRDLGNSRTNLHTADQMSMVSFMTPEQYVQEQMHQQAQEFLSRQLRAQRGGQMPSEELSPYSWIYPPYLGSLHHCPLPPHVINSRNPPRSGDIFNAPWINFPSDVESGNIPRYLQNAYRVGMKALEALANRMPEDRPEIKYAQSPPCSDDIRWLCALAASLGPHYLREFCSVVISAVYSPYVLHDLALESARHFALYNPAQLSSHLRSPSVSPIVQKSLAMYTELVHRELVLLSQAGYNDFVDLLRRARSAFCMAPGGMTKFNELLEMIRKTYSKKRELWQLIMTGLSRA